MNDCLQSVISASYPVLRSEHSLTFAQIGIITLVYQIAASVFQPLIGLLYDKYPSAWSLPIGMTFTLTGLISLSQAHTMPLMLVSVFLVGIGSSTMHPEASRLTSLASGGKRGFAQSLFQVGGNFGSALGPLLVALIVSPHGYRNIAYFAILALIAIGVMMPVCLWYKKHLKSFKARKQSVVQTVTLPLSKGKTVFTIGILLVLLFSKYVYMASLSSYYTFYLIYKFGVTVQQSQVCLFVFLLATAIGTMAGGPIGDRIGRKYVIWASILGAAPFALIMPHANLMWTIILSFFIGLIISSAFPSILVYAQELLPYKLGMVSGLFYGFAFGIAGISAAFLGKMADAYTIEAVYKVVAYMPLLGLVTYFLPDLRRKKK
jgi:FSR family fosmidomycin resistance protein-like MFS transporter